MKVISFVTVFFFVSILSSIQAYRKRPSDSYYHSKARKYHGDAINLANQGDYRMALSHFRASVRLDSKNANYWNDLGVTEMRMGQFLKAKERFFKALQIDPYNNFAVDNLRELAEFLHENPSTYFEKNGALDQFKASKKLSNRVNLQDNRQHQVLEPRILTKTEFLTIVEETNGIKNQSFTSKQRELFSYPFLVRGYLNPEEDADIAVFDYFHIDHLQSRHGKQNVDFYPHNMKEETAKPYFNTLGPALDDVMTLPEGYYVDVDASEGGTYVQWNLDATVFRQLVEEATLQLPRFFDLEEDLNIFGCLGETKENSVNKIVTNDLYRLLSEFYIKVHWKMLIIGESNAGMFFHQDVLQASAWQLLLSGQKKWHVCPGKRHKPSSSSSSSSDKTSELSQSEGLHHLYYKAGDINMFDYNIDYKKFPLLKQATCYETTLYPGDFFYYPGDYWHQTLNLLQPTTALSSSVLFSRYDFEIMTRELRRECYGSARIFTPNPLLCSRLEKCFESWGSSHIGIEGEADAASTEAEEEGQHDEF